MSERGTRWKTVKATSIDPSQLNSVLYHDSDSKRERSRHNVPLKSYLKVFLAKAVVLSKLVAAFKVTATYIGKVQSNLIF